MPDLKWIFVLYVCAAPAGPPSEDETSVTTSPAPTAVPWFRDATEPSGVHFGEWSGVAIHDADQDGLLDLEFVHDGETHLFLNRTAPDQVGFRFEEAPADGGAGSPLMTAGLPSGAHDRIVADFDHDTRKDLVVREGTRLVLYSGTRGDTRIPVASDVAGDAFQQACDCRGLYSGDLDNDGDLDLVVTQRGGSPRILENRTRTGRALILRGLQPGCRVNINYGPIEVTRFFTVPETYVTAGGHSAAELHLPYGDYEEMGVRKFYLEGGAINLPSGKVAGEWLGQPAIVMQCELDDESRFVIRPATGR